MAINGPSLAPVRPLLVRPVSSGRPPSTGRAEPAARAPRFDHLLADRRRAPSSGPAPDAVPAEYRSLVGEAARRYRLDPALVAGVIQVESGFNPLAESPAGARGLMQLMDATARGLGVADPFDPTQNVMGGARLLRQLLDRYDGNLELALAAYNAGPGAVDRHGGVPPYAETRRYVPLVLAAVGRFRPGPLAGPNPTGKVG